MEKHVTERIVDIIEVSVKSVAELQGTVAELQGMTRRLFEVQSARIDALEAIVKALLSKAMESGGQNESKNDCNQR